MKQLYRKNTNTDIYLNWLSHAPNTWKRGTLKVLINRVYTLCSTNYHLKEELRYLEKVFVERNSYPRWLVKQMMKKVLDEQPNRNVLTVTINLPNEESHCSIKTSLTSLPCKGKQCLSFLKISLEDVFETLWRQTKRLLGIPVSNKSKCVSNKSIFHKSIADKSKANRKCIN